MKCSLKKQLVYSLVLVVIELSEIFEIDTFLNSLRYSLIMVTDKWIRLCWKHLPALHSNV